MRKNPLALRPKEGLQCQPLPADECVVCLDRYLAGCSRSRWCARRNTCPVRVCWTEIHLGPFWGWTALLAAISRRLVACFLRQCRFYSAFGMIVGIVVGVASFFLRPGLRTEVITFKNHSYLIILLLLGSVI